MASPSSLQSVIEIDRLLRAAIMEKHPILAVYDGRSRWLCPHMLGRNRDGQVRILCLQFRGESASGLEHMDSQGDWRCLAMEKFSSVTPVKEAWRTPAGSLRQPKCIDQVELRASD